MIGVGGGEHTGPILWIGACRSATAAVGCIAVLGCHDSLRTFECIINYLITAFTKSPLNAAFERMPHRI